ncbi:MAG: hypothetical protein B7Y85_11875 [Brevundimonas sp. 32-68-21]|nr:MAG: hypothetical protein B7Y85_11875 [Brevundimonas sp. 32-68-21]
MSEDEKPQERRRMVKPPTGGTAAGRGMGTKMKTADTKSMSSQQWIKRQLAESDMAHNTVGHRQTDHLKIIALIEIAADFAIRTLRPGGNFVSKNFQGGDAGGVLARLREEFETVKYVKPASSRKDSAEVFLVALNKR